MLPRVESSCAELHLDFSHLQSRKSLLPSLPHRDTEGPRENTESWWCGWKAAERRAAVLFPLQLRPGKRVIEFVAAAGALVSFFEEACMGGTEVNYSSSDSLWSPVLLEIGCYNCLVFHRKEEILRLNSVMFIGS